MASIKLRYFCWLLAVPYFMFNEDIFVHCIPIYTRLICSPRFINTSYITLLRLGCQHYTYRYDYLLPAEHKLMAAASSSRANT